MADGSLKKRGEERPICHSGKRHQGDSATYSIIKLKPTVVIINGMAVIQMSKSAGASTFGELSEKYYGIFTAPLLSDNCVQVHIIFDQYWERSIKGGERQRRGSTVALEVLIGGPATPVPRQWGKYIANPKNKVWLKLLELDVLLLTVTYCLVTNSLKL